MSPSADTPPLSLREPGAVLLISCYELGHQPLAIASPVALMRSAGYRPAAIDLAAEGFDSGLVTRARLVALSVPMHTALRLGTRAAQRVRAINPDAVLVFYGLYAALNAAALFELGADAVVGGEYEEPLLRLVEARERGGGGPIPGVQTRDDAQAPSLKGSALPVPERDLLPPLERYARLEAFGETRLAGQVEASRGCLHHCRHCPIPPVYGGRLVITPRNRVLADIRNQVARGAAHITFGDPDFLNGPGHSLAIARAMHAEFPALTFDVTAKVSHLLRYANRLPELAALGCLFIVTAVESLNDRILGILDKGHTRADVARALALGRETGISLRPSLVPFTPWTTLDDYFDLLDWVERDDLTGRIDPVQMSIRLLVPPGSLLLDHPDMRPHLGPLQAGRFTYLWRHPDPRLDGLQEEVAGIVEAAARDRDDPRRTLAGIRAAAVRTADGRTARNDPPAAVMADERADDGEAWRRPAALVAPPPPHDKGRPPRLSEPWFC